MEPIDNFDAFIADASRFGRAGASIVGKEAKRIIAALRDAHRAAYDALVAERDALRADRDEAIGALADGRGMGQGWWGRAAARLSLRLKDATARAERAEALLARIDAPPVGGTDAPACDSIQHDMETRCPKCGQDYRLHKGDEVEGVCPSSA